MDNRIALIPGDGMGREVIPEGVRVLEALAGHYGFGVTFTEFPIRRTDTDNTVKRPGKKPRRENE